MTRPRLMIVVTSTRPSRVGHKVAAWAAAQAEAHGGFDIDFVDLAELDLPMMDEPNHPRLQKYTNDHTHEWSARVDAADAFVFVVVEYNHSFSAPLKNAIDFLLHEWAYKPVGFVSYGGVAAGTRAVQALKTVCAAVRLTPVVEAVPIPWISQQLDEDGSFKSSDVLEAGAKAMLDELAKLTPVLAQLRAARA